MPTLHLIAHTHWDREWYLTFQQFRLKLVHLIDGLLDLLERDPKFKFFMLDGQTIVLDDYLQIRPDREQALRDHVLKGRILIGPWHILPDEFLVSPEATIRNLLQGDRTARRFGPKMMAGYLPDPFGHIGQMPQILNGFGIQTAALRRGLSDEACELWWEAPDGSRVFTAYLRDGYDNAAWLPTSEPGRFAAEVVRLQESLIPHAAADDLALMFGTDHMEPPADTTAAIASAKGRLNGSSLVLSTLPRYLEAAQTALGNKTLPVVRGELRSSKKHHLLPGVLSTRMWIKQRNRAAETLLERWAEPFTTFAELIAAADSSSAPHPASSVLHEAWRLLMENHPHDSICGCSIDQVHEEMRVRFDQVEQIGEELAASSLSAIAAAADTRAPIGGLQSAILVFNPTGAARNDHVVVDLALPQDADELEVVDETGRPIPQQLTGTGHRELVNFTIDKAGFRDTLATIREGRVAGMAIQRIRLERRAETVLVEAILDEGGRPDIAAWNEAARAAQALLADPEITSFQVRATTARSASILLAPERIPGRGWRTFWVRARKHTTPVPATQPAQLNPITRPLVPIALRLAQTPFGQNLLGRIAPGDELKPPFKIENDLLVVEASEEDGTLTVRDRRNVAVYRGLHRFVDGGDCGDAYNYAPPPADQLICPRLKTLKVFRREARPALELTYELEAPLELTADRSQRLSATTTVDIVSRVSLSPGVPRVDVVTELRNGARDHRLRVHFPTPFRAEVADYDGHFEVVCRPIGVPAFDDSWVEAPRPEVPQRAFTDVSQDGLGLMIANKGLPEVEVLKAEGGKAEVALTLLRCVGWLSRDDFSTRRGHAGPSLPTPGAQMTGTWTFEYSIIPHGGDWSAAHEQACAFEAPLRAVGTDLHQGSLAITGSFLTHTPETFAISAVKPAESGAGWIVRGCNLTGAALQVTLKPWRKFKSARRVDLAEQKQAALKPAADGVVTFPAGPHEIVTVLFDD